MIASRGGRRHAEVMSGVIRPADTAPRNAKRPLEGLEAEKLGFLMIILCRIIVTV